MPKRNVYISEALDALIQEHESPIPLATIFQDAVMEYLSTGICPTCGQATPLKKSQNENPVRITGSATVVPTTRTTKQCKNHDVHDAHNFKQRHGPGRYRCPGVL